MEGGVGVELERAALQRFLERLQWARMYSACAVAHAMRDMESDSAALASRLHALHFLVTQLLKVAASVPWPSSFTTAVLSARHSEHLLCD